MNAVRMLRRFISLDRRMMLLLVEALLYLAWARLLLFIPFSKVAPSLGIRMRETSHSTVQHNRVLLRQISVALHRISRHTFWECRCLVRAIAAMKMLERRRIESTLYLGTATEGKELIAHAWLRSGSFYLTGAKEMKRFTVVERFAKEMENSEYEG